MLIKFHSKANETIWFQYGSPIILAAPSLLDPEISKKSYSIIIMGNNFKVDKEEFNRVLEQLDAELR
jgi:hypothetical protein